MAVDLQYALTVDGSRWVPVPSSFPWGEFATAQEWAAGLAADLLAGTGAEVSATALLTEQALTVQATPPPFDGAQERFWRTEFVGGYPIVIHLYITDTWAASAEDLLQFSRVGIGGVVQTWSIVDGTPFDAAIDAVVSADLADMTIGAVRALGARDGMLFLLDYLDQDPIRLEAVQPELQEMFRSIRFS